MKKLFFVFMFISLFGFRRGEEDPFISFRSRDARLLGTWKLVNIDYNVDYKFYYPQDTTIYGYRVSYFSDYQRIHIINPNSTESFNYTLQIKIMENGFCQIDRTIDSVHTTISCLWHWLNSDKNKIQIYFESRIFDPFISIQTFYVKQLKNKSLKLEINYTSEETADYQKIKTTYGEFEFVKTD